MNEKTLILIDATGIQEYIFGSNQLAQNIGASELVTQATTDWVVKTLEDLKLSHNAVKNPENGEWEPSDRSIDADGIQAEIIYMGGGNAMLLINDAQKAKGISRLLTYHALEHAPGLGLVLVREHYDGEKKSLAQHHQELRSKLAKRKLNRPHSSPLLGLGVTAACVYTGLPAIGMSNDPAIVGVAATEKARQTGEEPVLISAVVAAKLRAEEAGKERLKRHLPQVEKSGYEFIYNFDDFGEKGESSFLAIIHADGNNMGERIKAIGAQYNDPSKNNDYIRAMRSFSKSVKNAAEKALNATVNMLLNSNNISKDAKGADKYGGVVPHRRSRSGKYLLPFRPIVFGGDDVTFVTEGRLGLTLASKYLEIYSSQSLDDISRMPAYARAGVAVVKSHYPFSRAYDLAEELIISAKSYIRDQNEKGELTALDWHFAVGGLVLPLKQVRQREYLADDGASSMLMRPLHLGNHNGDWRSWEVFTKLLEEFSDEEKGWAGRRNKVKAFREALRAGPDMVKQFLTNYELHLPDIASMPADMRKQGWQGSYCGYFDAIEALDFYVPLKGG